MTLEALHSGAYVSGVLFFERLVPEREQPISQRPSMPHLRFRGVKSDVVQKLSETLHLELAPLIGTSIDNFTFELIETQYFAQGSRGGEYPFIEILWFERGPAIKQAVVSHVTECISKLNGLSDIAVVFRPLDPNDYFENGKHF